MEQVERILALEYGDNPLWRWGVALAVAVLAAGLAFVVRGRVLKRLRVVTARTHTVWDDAIVDAVEQTKGGFIVLLALLAGARTLALPESVQVGFGLAMTVTVLLLIGTWMQASVRGAITRWNERQSGGHHATLAAAVGFVTRLIVWSIVVLLILSNLGVEVSALVAGLGIGGVAAALAVQNVLSDVFSALSIYLDRPFDIGDFIVVGSDMGTVMRVGWRSTRVRAIGGDELIFPNSDLADSRIHNFRRMFERRVVTGIGLVYETEERALREVPTLLREAVEEVDGVRFDRAHFKAFGASSLDFELVYFVLSKEFPAFMDAQQAILLGILGRLRARGLAVAVPTRTVHVASLPGDGDGRGDARADAAPEGGRDSGPRART